MDSNCLTCYKDNTKTYRLDPCIICKAGYALHYSGACLKCPSNCISCYFGGINPTVSNYDIINYSAQPELFISSSVDLKDLLQYNLLCIECLDNFYLS